MGTPADGIKDLLVAAGVGIFNTTSGWSIVIGKVVPQPDNVIIIRETGGQPPNPKWLLDYPSVQIVVRAGENSYVAARGKAESVKNALLGLVSQDLNGDRWVQINMIGDIFHLGEDEMRRPRFTLNFGLIIEPAPSLDSSREPL